jgi:two-component system sensor histidine kinase YesM
MKRSLNSNFLIKNVIIILTLILMIVALIVLAGPRFSGWVTRGVYAGIVLITIMLLIILLYTYVRNFYIPLKRLENKMKEFEGKQYFSAEGLPKNTDNLLEKLNAIMELQKTELEREHARAIIEQKMKYAELQNQINPHFLYNTLENIRGQAIIDDNDVIANMTEALSKFFRYNISKDNDIVKLADELDNIKNYIRIQQYRFRDRFVFQIYDNDTADAVYHCMIPKMTLQPIVENAIFHGIENKIGQGHIDVHIEVSSNHMIVLVADDGIGMEEAALEKLNQKLNTSERNKRWVDTKENSDGIAMENVNNRLKLLYGEEFGISVSSMRNVGTEVEIVLPYLPEEKA